MNSKFSIITGLGFIGGHLCHALRSDGKEVKVADFYPSLQMRRGDFISAASLERATLFHLGANTNPQEEAGQLQSNLHMALDLFKEALAKGCKKIIWASSMAIFGDAPCPPGGWTEDSPKNPLTPYAWAKLRLEEEAMKLASQHPGASLVGLRFSNVWALDGSERHKGAAASMVSQLHAQMSQKGEAKLFADGSQARDWLHVSDAVQALYLAAEYKGSGIFNIGSGKAVSFNNVVAWLNEKLHAQIKPTYLDNPYVNTYQSFTLANISKARRELAYSPSVYLGAHQERQQQC